MKRTLSLLVASGGVVLLMGAANGAWLQRVSPSSHAKTNPLAGNAGDAETAAISGSHIYSNECAKCHGADGMGKAGRPAVISERVAHASDGDLFWLMENGVPYRGMPPWNMLPAKQRWQLVAYLRSLNTANAPAEPPQTGTNHP